MSHSIWILQYIWQDQQIISTLNSVFTPIFFYATFFTPKICYLINAFFTPHWRKNNLLYNDKARPLFQKITVIFLRPFFLHPKYFLAHPGVKTEFSVYCKFFLSSLLRAVCVRKDERDCFLSYFRLSFSFSLARKQPPKTF